MPIQRNHLKLVQKLAHHFNINEDNMNGLSFDGSIKFAIDIVTLPTNERDPINVNTSKLK